MEAALEFETGSFDVDVDSLGGDRYRLACASTYLSEPLLEHGDVFEAAELHAGALRFVRLVRRSDWHNYCRVLHPSAFQTKAFAEFAELARQSGGKMEIAFGGVFHLSLPLRSRFDPVKAARAAIRKHGPARAEVNPLANWLWGDALPAGQNRQSGCAGAPRTSFFAP